MASFGNVTVVVAHGAWADGSSWSEVISRLTEKGVRAVAAPLPLSSLSEDAAALRRTFARTRDSIIVAGHAYAGAVIATANDERVRGLVYIAALAPSQGETVADVFYRDKPHPMAPQLVPDEDGWIWMPDEGFTHAFAQNATADQIALARAVQRPISVKCIQEAVPEPAWTRKPAWYLIAEEDRMINPKTQHFMAERMRAHSEALPVDHAPLLTAPEAVMELILKAAQAA